MKRKCADCPTEVMAVCRHAFGKYWNVKSGDGEGCDYPLDDAAKAWYAAGWKPGTGATVKLVLPTRPTVHNAQLPARPTVHNAQLKAPSRVPMAQVKAPSPAHYAHVATANSRVNNLQVKMPRRPIVSARIAKQAELFFRGLK